MKGRLLVRVVAVILGFTWAGLTPVCAQQDQKAALLQQVRDLDGQASVLFHQGRYSEALPLSQRAVSLSEQAVGVDDPLVAAMLANLAAVYSVRLSPGRGRAGTSTQLNGAPSWSAVPRRTRERANAQQQRSFYGS